MMVTHMLAHLNGDDLAKFPGEDCILNGAVERCVAQHMTDYDFAAVSFGCVLELSYLVWIQRKGLFQQKIIPLVKNRY